MNNITKRALVNVGTTHISNYFFPFEGENGKKAAIVISIALGALTGLGIYFAVSLKAATIATFTVMTINASIRGPTPKVNYTVSFNEIGSDMLGLIIDFAMPNERSNKEVSNSLNQFSLTCKSLARAGKNQIRKLELVKKYSFYQQRFLNSQLYDALLTGVRLPFADSSFDTYTKYTDQDIIDIVRLNPESLNTKDGTLRCRDNVTPFWAACINDNVSLPMIQLLLVNGANPRATILTSNHGEVPILKDIEDCGVKPDRVSEIIKLVEGHEQRESENH